MKKNPLLFAGTLLFFIFSCLCISCPIVCAEDPLLKIQATPDQNSVKGGMMFLVQAQVVNASSDTSVDFWSNSCSYEKHWVTDNSAVFIQSWTCNENVLEEVNLEPGGVYGKNLILYIPKKDETGQVTFRLGFKRMAEDGDVAEPLWSDPVTMNVVVPEELKEAAPVPDQAPEAPVEMNEVPPGAAADTATAAGSQPLVFQDPGVPIRVPPGKEFSIALASNPSTGFGWKMTLPEDQKAVKLLGSGYVAPQTTRVGAPGEEVYKFQAIAPGETKADFVYARPWDPKEAPTRKIFTILVEEN
jgi:inhibitor of cysteine peptidase